MSSRPVKKLKVGIAGCGGESGVVFSALRKFPSVELAGCADPDFFRAEAKGEQYGVKPYALQELIAEKSIPFVINLAPPRLHAALTRQLLEAGKHVYAGRPLAPDFATGKELLELAAAKGVRLGGASDAFLDGPFQTARQLIDAGAIGTPLAAAAHLSGPGPESWHPDPEAFYQPGGLGGPMLDLGPRLLTALVSLLGPVRRATGSARASLPERTVASEKRRGEKIPVGVPTHYAAVYDFVSGPVATMTVSYDLGPHQMPFLEIYGTEGSLSLPDPAASGPVRLRRLDEAAWSEIPLTHPRQAGSALGIADMVHGILYGRAHRTSGEMALHVLEGLLAVEGCSFHHVHAALQSTCVRPAPLPPGLSPGEVDV